MNAAALLLTGLLGQADLKPELFSQIDGMRTVTQQMVDQVFSYAELGFEESETSRYVTGILERAGFKIERGAAGIPTNWTATWGSGKPVIGFIADLDGLPGMSQKPGVAYRAPLVEGAPGHGEGHNAGQAVNVTAALALQKVMRAHKIAGTLKLMPGIAEELLATKAFYVRAGLLEDVDIMLGAHVSSAFQTDYGPRELGMISVQYTFHGASAHSAGAPWKGRSALDAVELMDLGWNMRREHLKLEHRSHYVIVNGGEQPNVVPPEATVWYFFRDPTAAGVRDLHKIANDVAQGAALMTNTTFDQRTVGSAWPTHFNKVIAETQQVNIERVGMPAWTEADQTLARALQKEMGAAVDGLATKVRTLDGPAKGGAGSDDIGDISWAVPTVYLRYPANIPGTPGHSWFDAVAMATPIAHKGSTAGAKAQAATALDFLRSPELVKKARDAFDEQTKSTKYQPLMAEKDQPAVTINREKMQRFVPALKRFHFDPKRHKTYLDQLGIKYPTVRQ